MATRESDHMGMEQAILEVVRNEMTRAGVTRADLARALGTSRATVTRRLQGSTVPVRLGGFDYFVDTAAPLVGRSRVWLWREAVKAMGRCGLEREQPPH